MGSNSIYTYNKRVDGWYLTALDADDLEHVRFAAKVGPSLFRFDNAYSALSLSSDGKTVWLGTLFGITRIVVQ